MNATGRAEAGQAVAGSVVDPIVESLTGEIVRGEHAPGVRLPAERDLAGRFGASRISVRDALRRLEELRLVSVRRGSGATVRNRREWSLEALPACVRHGGVAPAPAVLEDLFSLRRAVILHAVREVARRVGPGDLGPAREVLSEAWAARRDDERFVALDLEAQRRVLEAAGMLATLWLVNDLAAVYGEMAGLFAVPVPEDYVAVYTDIFDALEAGDGEGAAAVLDAYLIRQAQWLEVSA